MNSYKALKRAVDDGSVDLVDCSLTGLLGESYSANKLENTSVSANIGRQKQTVPLNALRYANGTVLAQPGTPYKVSVEFLKEYDKGSTNFVSIPVGKRHYTLADIAPVLPGIKANVKAARDIAYERLSKIEKLSGTVLKGVAESYASDSDSIAPIFGESQLEQLSKTPLFSTNLYTQLPNVIEALLEKPR